jgi:hypothetical protein
MALKKLHKAYTRPEETISNVLSDIDRYKPNRTHGSTNTPGARSTAVQPVVLAVPVADLSLPPANLTVNSDLIFAVELPAL